jgi:hypothetical protein
MEQNQSERHYCHRPECAEGECLLARGLYIHLRRLMNQKVAMMVLLGLLLCLV